MAKRTGLGSACFVDEYDISGDVTSVNGAATTIEPLTPTGIDKEAMERLNGLRTGELAVTSWFNPSNNQQHEALNSAGLPDTDVLGTFFVGQAIGNPACSLQGKQASYVGTRGQDGSFTFDAQLNGDGRVLDWGEQLTAGLDTLANGGMNAGVDNGAATSLGWQAYLHVTAFTGTDCLVIISDSADGSSWSFFAGSVFTSVTGPTSERIEAVGATDAVRRHVRVEVSGTFSSITFAVNFVRNRVARTAGL